MQMITLMASVINLGLVIAILGGIVALQIFLSKRKSKWLGLILPISFFIPTLLIILLILLNTVETNFFNTIMMLFPVLLLANIPSIICLCIYIICRKSHSAKQQLDKMNIQDL